MATVNITVSSDLATLGSEATESDLERYTAGLARLIAREFGCGVEVDTDCVSSTKVECANNALRERISDRVREIESGDEWVSLLEGGQ